MDLRDLQMTSHQANARSSFLLPSLLPPEEPPSLDPPDPPEEPPEPLEELGGGGGGGGGVVVDEDPPPSLEPAPPLLEPEVGEGVAELVGEDVEDVPSEPTGRYQADHVNWM